MYVSFILIKVYLFENSLAGVAEHSNGFPTANEEHVPFVIYETFLKKNSRRISFLKFPASCSLYALYTHEDSSPWKTPYNGYPGARTWVAHCQRKACVLCSLRGFSQNSPDEFLLKVSC